MIDIRDRTLIYDADCGFCTRSAQWLAKNDRVHITAWQGLDLAAIGLTEADVTTAAYWYDNARVQVAAERAIACALIARGSIWAVAGRIILLPGVRHIAAPIYRVIARNRHAMPGGTDACKLPQ